MNNKILFLQRCIGFILCSWYYSEILLAVLVITFIFIPHRKIFILVLLTLPYTLCLACALYSELVCGHDVKFRSVREMVLKTWYCRI
jgi:hypothetical protein